MKETYFIKRGNIVTINYAYNDSGIIVYPDLIKGRIALDNGEVLGIETTGYKLEGATDYYLVYATNTITGYEGYYLYDTKENSVQRYEYFAQI